MTGQILNYKPNWTIICWSIQRIVLYGTDIGGIGRDERLTINNRSLHRRLVTRRDRYLVWLEAFLICLVYDQSDQIFTGYKKVELYWIFLLIHQWTILLPAQLIGYRVESWWNFIPTQNISCLLNNVLGLAQHGNRVNVQIELVGHKAVGGSGILAKLGQVCGAEVTNLPGDLNIYLSYSMLRLSSNRQILKAKSHHWIWLLWCNSCHTIDWYIWGLNSIYTEKYY